MWSDRQGLHHRVYYAQRETRLQESWLLQGWACRLGFQGRAKFAVALSAALKRLSLIPVQRRAVLAGGASGMEQQHQTLGDWVNSRSSR